MGVNDTNRHDNIALSVEIVGFYSILQVGMTSSWCYHVIIIIIIIIILLYLYGAMLQSFYALSHIKIANIKQLKSITTV